jgi:hypothetical protein
MRAKIPPTVKPKDRNCLFVISFGISSRIKVKVEVEIKNKLEVKTEAELKEAYV